MSRQHDRIVVSIDQQQAANNRSSGLGWRKLLLIVGLLGVTMAMLVIVGVFIWWQYYKTTPTYSLALVIDAAQRNDKETFESLVDIDSIGDSLVAQVSGRMGISAGEGITSALRRQVERLAPSISSEVKESIREAVKIRMKEVSSKTEKAPFFVTAIALPFFVDVVSDGDTARATVIFQNRPIELRMRRNDRWQIKEVRDDVALQRIVQEILKRAPGRLGILNN